MLNSLTQTPVPPYKTVIKLASYLLDTTGLCNAPLPLPTHVANNKL